MADEESFYGTRRRKLSCHPDEFFGIPKPTTIQIAKLTYDGLRGPRWKPPPVLPFKQNLHILGGEIASVPFDVVQIRGVRRFRAVSPLFFFRFTAPTERC